MAEGSSQPEAKPKTPADINPSILAARRDLSSQMKEDLTIQEEQLAQKRRTGMFRTPQMQVAIRIMRGNPDLWRSAKPFLEHAAEYRKAGTAELFTDFETDIARNTLIDLLEQEGSPEATKMEDNPPRERHRDYTALLAACMGSEEMELVSRRAIRDAMQKESDMHRGKIKDGSEENVRWVMQGAGIAAANLGTAMFAINPDNVPLAYEQLPYVGGPFGGKGRGWRLNSRTRPFTDNPDDPNLPGTAAPLNTVGRFAPLQQQDITGDRYAWQKTLAIPEEAALATSVPIMTDQRIISLKPDRNNPLGIIVVSEHIPTGKIYEQEAYGFINTGGLGKQKIGVSQTPEFLKIREKAEEELAKGAAGNPQYLLYLEFMGRISNEDIPNPIYGYENVGVMGSGDGGITVLEGLLREPNTPATIARPKKVYLFGAKAGTKLQFQSQQRPRYVEAGVDFPRTDDDASSFDYASTIIPLGKALEVTEDDGALNVLCEELLLNNDGTVAADNTGKPIVVGTTTVALDHLIDTTGYDNSGRREILKALYAQYFDTPEEIAQNLPECLLKEGSIVTTADKSVLTVESINQPTSRDERGRFTNTQGARDAQGRFIPRKGKFSFKKADGSVENIEISLGGNSLRGVLRTLQQRGVVSIEIPGEVPEPSDSEIIRDQGVPIARQLPGRYRIYEVGTVANLPLEDAERRTTPAFSKARENVVAAFRNGPKAEALGRRIAFSDQAQGVTSSGIESLYPPVEFIDLPPLPARPRFLQAPDSNPKIEVTKTTEYAAYRSKIINPHVLQYAVGVELFPYNFPEGLENITFDVKKAESGTPGTVAFEIATGDAYLAGDPVYSKMMNDVFLNPIMQKIMCQGTIMTSQGEFKIHIPIRDGVVDPAGIRWEVPQTVTSSSAFSARRRRSQQDGTQEEERIEFPRTNVEVLEPVRRR